MVFSTRRTGSGEVYILIYVLVLACVCSLLDPIPFSHPSECPRDNGATALYLIRQKRPTKYTAQLLELQVLRGRTEGMRVLPLRKSQQVVFSSTLHVRNLRLRDIQ